MNRSIDESAGASRATLRAAPAAPSAQQPAGYTRYRMLAWLCVAAVIAYICRNCIAAAESTIRREMGMSEQRMGLVMSAFMLTYSLGQIPSGLLADRWGSRRLLPMLSVIWSLATGAMGLAVGWVGLAAARLAGGAAQAGLFPASTNTLSKWMARDERALASGALGGAMSIGAAISTAVTGAALRYLDWRWVFVLFTGLGLIWARAFYAWFRDLPQQHAGVNDAELAVICAGRDVQQADRSVARVSTPWLALFSSPAMWWICGQQFFRAASNMFFFSWFPTFLQEVGDVSVSESGLLATLPLLGVVPGTLLGGAASDWVLRRTGSLRLARQGLSAIILVACAGTFGAAYCVESVSLIVTLITVGMFLFGLSSPSGYAITIDMGGQHVATVFSTMNMAGNVGALLFPTVAPLLMKQLGSWESVLLLVAGLLLAAAVCWMMLKPYGTVVDQALYGRPAENS